MSGQGNAWVQVGVPWLVVACSCLIGWAIEHYLGGSE